MGKKVLRLHDECARTPFHGTAKPEPLKGDLAGWWSRRVTQEHRLIYKVMGATMTRG
jgi:toxin YoeB